MKKKLIITSLITLSTLVVVFILFWVQNGGTDERYQHDADIVRLNHLTELATYIEEYKDKTGEYPFVSGSEIPSYTYIASADQMKYINEKPPYEHTEHDVNELITILEDELEKEINMPFDPQKSPVNKPNFYIYMTHENYYVLAIHLHNEFSFSQKIAPHYNKLQVSNIPNQDFGVWNYSSLIKNDDFNMAINEELYKKGYFK